MTFPRFLPMRKQQMPMPSQRMKRSHMRTRSKDNQGTGYQVRDKNALCLLISPFPTPLSVARHVFKSNLFGGESHCGCIWSISQSELLGFSFRIIVNLGGSECVLHQIIYVSSQTFFFHVQLGQGTNTKRVSD